MRPSLAYLNPGQMSSVDIRVIPNSQSEASIIKDKFLITVVLVGDEQYSNQQMADLMKVGIKARNLGCAPFPELLSRNFFSWMAKSSV